MSALSSAVAVWPAVGWWAAGAGHLAAGWWAFVAVAGGLPKSFLIGKVGGR